MSTVRAPVATLLSIHKYITVKRVIKLLTVSKSLQDDKNQKNPKDLKIAIFLL